MAHTGFRRRTAPESRRPDQESKDFEIHPDVIDGDRIVRKSATGADRKHLRREASVLAQIGSPRVIELIELVESDSSTEMVTVDAGSRTLDEPSKMGPSELLRALRNCVDAVRDLHASGWVHGALRPEHVIVGARGRIHMCSLGAARRLSTSASVDEDGPGSDMRTDAVDLIELVREVGLTEVTNGPWRERRERTRLNRMILGASARAHDALRTTGSATEALNHLHQLLAEPLRPQGARVRRGAIGGGAGVRSGALRSIGTHREYAASATMIILAAALGIFLLSSATSARASGERPPEPPSVHARASTSEVPTTDGTLTLRTSDTDSFYGSDAPRGPTGDKTPGAPYRTDRVTAPTPDGVVVVAGGVSYTVGRPGDFPMVGDWFCDGEERLVLLRPSTGELFMFDDWADPGSPEPGRVIGVQPGTDQILPTMDQCGVLLLTGADQDALEVALEPPSGPSPASGDDLERGSK